MGIWEKLKNIFQRRKEVAEKEFPGLEEGLAELFKQTLSLSFEKTEGDLPLTCSRFGGCPALPEGFIWPKFFGEGMEDGEKRERPLTFLLQINLEEAAAFDEEGLLPPRGMLYFFYETESMCWGFDPSDKGCARVYFYDGKLSALGPVLPPDEKRFSELRIEFTAKYDLPDWEEFISYYGDMKAGYDWEDYERYVRKCGVDADCEEEGKLLGYADLIQGEMLLECEQASRGIYVGGGRAETDEGAAADCFEKSRDWTLLLQLGSVNTGEEELDWGDCGNLYFYIRKQDLAAKNFDDVWLVLQCT